MALIQIASIFGIPVNPIATVRNAAPARIQAIIQEVFVAPISPSRNVPLESDRVYQERNRASRTPTAAASVGEAMPE